MGAVTAAGCAGDGVLSAGGAACEVAAAESARAGPDAHPASSIAHNIAIVPSRHHFAIICSWLADGHGGFNRVSRLSSRTILRREISPARHLSGATSERLRKLEKIRKLPGQNHQRAIAPPFRYHLILVSACPARFNWGPAFGEACAKETGSYGRVDLISGGNFDFQNRLGKHARRTSLDQNQKVRPITKWSLLFLGRV